MLKGYHCRMLVNPKPDHKAGPSFLSPENTKNVRAFHRALPEYLPTPLVRLTDLEKRLGIKGVYIKDESKRFGLKAFKGLGGTYALFRVVCEKLGLDAGKTSFEDLQSDALKDKVKDLVFVTATDGNHGKGVAWAAAKLGCQAYVYLPKGSSEERAQAIRDAGKAEAVITEWGYDDTVRYAALKGEECGWLLVQDTSWPGYETIPRHIIQGYTTMADEAANQLDEKGVLPTHVFLQAGVGAMAGGVTGYLRTRYKEHPPIISTVEPDEAACVFQSVLGNDGHAHPATGSGGTIMAGLNCGEVCMTTWPVLRDQADYYFSCPDFVAAHGMRVLAAQGVVSGESGAVTAGLLSLLDREDMREIRKTLQLNEDSVVLLINTEGDTDEAAYKAIVNGAEYQLPED